MRLPPAQFLLLTAGCLSPLLLLAACRENPTTAPKTAATPAAPSPKTQAQPLSPAPATSPAPASAAHWYDSWVADPLAKGAEVHSEFAFPAAGKHRIVFDATGPSEVGFVVQHGYDIHKAKGTIFMGTEDQPRMAGGSPGVRQTFTPVEGKITVVFENDSPIDTRLVVYIRKDLTAPK